MPPGVHSELNPNKPPSAHAMGVLLRLLDAPIPVQEVNQTVSRKLLQFGYIRVIDKPSPYKTHKPGRMVAFMVTTKKGRQALKQHLDNRRISRVMKGGL